MLHMTVISHADIVLPQKAIIGGERSLMPAAVGMDAVDFLIEHSGDRKTLK